MKNNEKKLDTIIGEHTKFKGEVNSEGGIRIDGEVEGKIICDGFLMIGEKALIKADIQSDEAIISGKVEGNITIEKKVELKSTASIQGDVIAKVLSMESGTQICGNCSIKQVEGETKTKKK
ncbi:MAG TPA: polymer-forming cytoskeletal protein [Candidatus Cloacimonetes bacterium]|nr:polymer-forming cytoskeletal protein [Candidatus Cloacimonadota bacterium]